RVEAVGGNAGGDDGGNEAGEIGGDQAVGIAIIIVAKLEVVVDPQLLVGIIAADQPVEPSAERLALQAKLLGEGLEPVERLAVILAQQYVEIVEVGILAAGIFIVAIGGDRGQLGAAKVVDQLARQAIVLDVRGIVAPGRDRHVAVIGIIVDDCAKG